MCQKKRQLIHCADWPWLFNWIELTRGLFSYGKSKTSSLFADIALIAVWQPNYNTQTVIVCVVPWWKHRHNAGGLKTGLLFIPVTGKRAEYLMETCTPDIFGDHVQSFLWESLSYQSHTLSLVEYWWYRKAIWFVPSCRHWQENRNVWSL